MSKHGKLKPAPKGNMNLPMLDKLATELHCGHNQLVGGYMRQPINIDPIDAQRELYQTTGDCVLNGRKCKQTTPYRAQRDMCYDCQVYKTQVEGT